MIFTMAFLLCFTFSCQQEEETTEEFIEEDAGCQLGEVLIGGLTEEELEALGDKVLEIWNEGNLDLVEEVYSPEYTICSDPHDQHENQTIDHETLKERVRLSRSIFSDLQWVVEKDPIIQGDRFAVRTTMSGTYVDMGKQFSLQRNISTLASLTCKGSM